jgi:iron complex outermembrane receptor protein
MNSTSTHARKLRRVVASLLAMSAAVANGQTATGERRDDQLFGTTVEEIIVTARKREESLQRTPVSVTAFNAATLERSGINNVAQLARFAPNVEISNGRADGGGSSLNAYIRGVGQQDFVFPTDPGVGVYVDGVYLARTVGASVDLSDIDRVEVLRGPQGTLYGKNTIGGAINVFTKKPSLDQELAGSLELTGGEFDRTDVKGYVMFPIVDGKLAAKVSGAFLKRDPAAERVLLGEGLGDEDKKILRLALRWAPTDTLDVLLAGDYQRQRQDGPIGTMVNRITSDVVLGPVGVPGDPTPSTPFDFADLYNQVIVPLYLNPTLGLPADSQYDRRWITHDYRKSNGTDPVYDDNDISGVSLAVDWEITDAVTLKSITAYRSIDADFPRDGDHTPYPVVATRNFFNQNQFSQELQLSGTSWSDRLEWLTGVYYMYERGRDDNKVELFDGLYQVIGDPSLTFNYLPLNKIKIDTYAIFGQGTYALGDTLALTLGLRYSKDEKEYFQDHRLQQIPDPDYPDGLARFVGPRTLTDEWDSFTPKVGLEYTPTDTLLVYGSYARGFKSGGWSPRPTQNNDTDLAYDEEFVDSFEVGTKSQLLDGRMNLNLAAFYNLYKDVQVTTIGSQGVGTLLLLTRNVGDAILYGAEAEIVARPAPGLDLNLAVGYLHNEWDEINIDDPGLTTEDKLVDAPEWTATIGAQYALPIGDAGDLVLRADASYKSLTWKDPFNLRRPTDLPLSEGYEVTVDKMAQDAFWLMNARIAFQTADDAWEFAVFGTNLTDEEYITSITPVTTFGYDEAYYGRPREWGVSIRYSF